ncbi:hypothetical protein Aperf_G00000030315 [Anoplocephala perfoliata]
MDFSNSEIDAQLLEQFRCLGTDDREELVKEFNQIVGSGVSTSICHFFLDLASWNLQKAIGAYYDLNFDTNISAASSPLAVVSQPKTFDAKFHPSPHSGPKRESPLIWCVQNTGTSSWPDGCYLAVEARPDLSSVTTCDKSVVWFPVSLEFRKSLNEITPGSYVHLVVDIPLPPEDIRQRIFSTNMPIVGAFKLCLPNGDRFGELLYCSLIPEVTTGSMMFRAGTPDTPILPPEPHNSHETATTTQQPMEEDL